MTLTEINRSIAELCGWKCQSHVDPSIRNEATACWYPPGNAEWQPETIPNYYASRDACAEFERTMDGTRMAGDYAIEIKAVILRNAGLYPSGLVGDFRFVCATAPQRCEALLRLHGKC